MEKFVLVAQNILVNSAFANIEYKRKKGNFYIAKLLTHSRNKQPLSFADNRLLYITDIAYNVNNKIFLKSRYGEDTNSNYFPQDLKYLFRAILEIDNSYENLLSKYPRDTINEAVYLTDNVNKFKDYIDPLEINLLRYKYGEDILNTDMIQIIKKYPEKVI